MVLVVAKLQISGGCGGSGRFGRGLRYLICDPLM